MTHPEYEFSLHILYFKDAEEVKKLQILLGGFLSWVFYTLQKVY